MKNIIVYTMEITTEVEFQSRDEATEADAEFVGDMLKDRINHVWFVQHAGITKIQRFLIEEAHDEEQQISV